MDGSITIEFAGVYQEGRFVAQGIAVNLYDKNGNTVGGFCRSLPSGLPADMKDLHMMLLPFLNAYVDDLSEEVFGKSKEVPF